MIASPYATERTKAQLEGRPENANLQGYNGKPYRTKQQRNMARQDATKKNGTFVSKAPVSYHPRPKSS